MSKATVCVAFICGAAVGIGGTWQYFKKKYEARHRKRSSPSRKVLRSGMRRRR